MAVRGRTDVAVDVEDLPVDAYVERPARSGCIFVFDDTIRLRGSAFRVAEERVFNVQRRSKLLVLLEGIDAYGKKRYIECPNLVAALTERLALRRSTSAGRSRKPGEHDCLLSAVVRQPVCAAVGAPQLEIRSRIARLQRFRHYACAADLPGGYEPDQAMPPITSAPISLFIGIRLPTMNSEARL